ncbi:hypothetical protein MMPV_004540 [Pyropia vietnamensis]
MARPAAGGRGGGGASSLRVPKYEHVRRSVWPPDHPGRPRRLPASDIQVCNCVPLPGAAAAASAATSTSAAATAASCSAETALSAPGSTGEDAGVSGKDSGGGGGNSSHSSGSGSLPVRVSARAAARRPRSSPGVGSANEPPVGGGVCGEGCLNRVSWIACDRASCPVGAACTNTPFQARSAPRITPFYTGDEKRDWALRSEEDLPAGTFIAEYAGDVLDEAAAAARHAAERAAGERHCYLMEVRPGQIIDARYRANASRFINSSCAPNCTAQKWLDAATGEMRVGIFTLEPVAAGAELTYDYRFYDGAPRDGGAYVCRCGSAVCRGWLDAHPDRMRRYGTRVSVRWDNARWYTGTITRYEPSTRRYRVVYDDGDVEHLPLDDVPPRPCRRRPVGESVAGAGGAAEGGGDAGSTAAVAVAPPPALKRRPAAGTCSPPPSPSTLAYRVLLESPPWRAADKVGATVRVRWDDGWYTGRVTAYFPVSRSYRIEYEDGDWEVLPLDREPGGGRKGVGKQEGGSGRKRESGAKGGGGGEKGGRGGKGGSKGRKVGGSDVMGQKDGVNNAGDDDSDDYDDSVEFEVLHMPGSTDESSSAESDG